MTPPKSPIPEMRVLSNSSSVEVVTLDEEESLDGDEVSRMTDLVQERMASLGLKPNGVYLIYPNALVASPDG